METGSSNEICAAKVVSFKSYYVVWKQKIMRKDREKFKSLNRTMQYGNLMLPVMTTTARIGLNRTMQYGNRKELLCSPSYKKFKSYYVVWKQRIWRQMYQSSNRFKSYYVVWKPQANDGCFHQHIQFKSYYVVWKRKKSENNWHHGIRFKSYYVVWKPFLPNFPQSHQTV